jgi:hypothetical protein
VLIDAPDNAVTSFDLFNPDKNVRIRLSPGVREGENVLDEFPTLFRSRPIEWVRLDLKVERFGLALPEKTFDLASIHSGYLGAQQQRSLHCSG